MKQLKNTIQEALFRDPEKPTPDSKQLIGLGIPHDFEIAEYDYKKSTVLLWQSHSVPKESVIEFNGSDKNILEKKKFKTVLINNDSSWLDFILKTHHSVYDLGGVEYIMIHKNKRITLKFGNIVVKNFMVDCEFLYIEDDLTFENCEIHSQNIFTNGHNIILKNCKVYTNKIACNPFSMDSFEKNLNATNTKSYKYKPIEYTPN